METRGAPNVARKRPIMIARMLNDTQCSVCRVRAPSMPLGLARPPPSPRQVNAYMAYYMAYVCVHGICMLAWHVLLHHVYICACIITQVSNRHAHAPAHTHAHAHVPAHAKKQFTHTSSDIGVTGGLVGARGHLQRLGSFQVGAAGGVVLRGVVGQRCVAGQGRAADGREEGGKRKRAQEATRRGSGAGAGGRHA